MNPRSPNCRAPKLPAPAFSLAVAILVLSCAPARAGCGAHDARPTLALEWLTSASASNGPAPQVPIPACSGGSCSRPTIPPVVPTQKVLPRLELCDRSPTELLPECPTGRSGDWCETFNPIGRVTDVARPPCAGARSALGG